MRGNNRAFDATRKINIRTGFIKYAEGSCMIEIGNTKVICTASLEDGVPVFLRGKGKGWIQQNTRCFPGHVIKECRGSLPEEKSAVGRMRYKGL